jgi:DMSO/TMAO reductase YedYZ molybdopterin-dependent catalytic subunit
LVFFLFSAAATTPAPASRGQLAAPTTATTRLEIKGSVATPLSLTAEDLRHMPRKTLVVANPHTQRKETYDGVLVEELLKRAGVLQGEPLRGRALATYVLAEAEDGYRVVFSLGELDSSIQESEIMVADQMDGAAIGDKVGPFRLVAPHEKRPARWVRMLKSLTVVTLPGDAAGTP